MRYRVSLVTVLLFVSWVVAAEAQTNPVQRDPNKPNLAVTFLGHCGFLFASGEQKILVDALTEPSTEWPYQTASPEVRQKMERGEAPFDNIRLVLISHNHIDHYNPGFVVRFLQHNPNAVVVTTPEVLLKIKKDSPEFAKVQARVVVPELEWKGGTTLVVNGIHLEIARLKHSNDKEWPSIVYTYLFDLGGKKVLYASGTNGYFPEEYETLGYSKRGIDLAFLNFDFMIERGSDGRPALNTAGLKEIRNLISPKIPVMMHVIPPSQAGVEKFLPEVQKELSAVMLFKPLETKTF